MNENGVYVLGIGHNTITTIDLLESCNIPILGLLHYNNERTGELYFGHPIIGCFEDFLTKESLQNKRFVLSMGDINIRKNLYNRIKSKGGIIPTIIHPRAIVSRYSSIGEGVIIMPGSIIQADTIIGDNTVITINSIISHSSKIGKHCFISGNSIIGAYIELEDCVQIGQSCTIVSGTATSIGFNSTLGAGSVLRTNMKPNSIYLGNPARFIKSKDE